jgi:uncharacterized protein YcsI (UPF0317 family)
MPDLSHNTGRDVRLAARRGELTGPTAGLALGYAQANLVAVPREFAYDFLLFCVRNPKPCPVLEVTDPGDPEPRVIAPGADLRTDLPCYRVWRDGACVDEPTDVKKYWRDDLVSFLLGCSFTFENALLAAGIPVRHIEMNRNVPMYRTNIACQPAGRFAGPLVVSMRPMTPAQATEATRICAALPQAHGAPIRVGDAAAIRICDIGKPDYGDAVEIRPEEEPVFWACGVTPQAALLHAKLPFAITHKPGCMFLTDRVE